MFSFTINDSNYTCPAGYGEITIEQYAAYAATVLPLQPVNPQAPQTDRSNSFARKLTQRLNAARIALAFDPLKHYEDQMVFNRAFIAHWMKVPAEIVDLILDEQVLQVVTFISKEWLAWQPRRVNVFAYGGKIWDVCYDLDTLGSVTDPSDMQQVMAHICKNEGNRMSPRDWGGVSLDIAASILQEIKRRHALIAPIIGASIINAMNLKDNGK